jgi:hypothetical protein
MDANRLGPLQFWGDSNMAEMQWITAAEWRDYDPIKYKTPEPDWGTEPPLTWDELCGYSPQLIALLHAAQAMCSRGIDDSGLCDMWLWNTVIRLPMELYVGWHVRTPLQKDNSRLRSGAAFRLAYEMLYDAFVACSCARCNPERQERNGEERSRVTPKLRFQVFERDTYRCRYCGRHLDALDCEAGEHLVIEHVVAIAKGGTSDLPNLVTACNTCNAGKGTKCTSRFVDVAAG